MPTSPIVQLLIAFAAASIAFAFWKGGRAERLAAGVVAANLATGLLMDAAAAAHRDELGFVSDGATAVALLLITLRYASPWMGGVMLLYAAQFSLHAWYLATGRPQTEYLHAVINNVIFTAVIASLVVGTAFAWRRRATGAA
jgi:hypothetical protein